MPLNDGESVDPLFCIRAIIKPLIRLASSLFLAAFFFFCPIRALAQTPPARLLPDELSGMSAESATTVGGRFPGAIITSEDANTVVDERYMQPYHVACRVYIGQAEGAPKDTKPTIYLRRFAVHAPDMASLPLARRVARLLLLLQGECLERLHHDHPSGQTVDVWLAPRNGSEQSSDAGGEQFRNQIYLYDIYSERRPIEWAREIAHEYGHYALPGVAGFTAPEEWANGVLGERLFWKWLHDDLRTGRLNPKDIPFVSPAEIDDYVERQVMPLIERIGKLGDGSDPATWLARRDAIGMDNYTAFALYIDTVYGSSGLRSALAYTEPKQGYAVIEAPDFLRGMQESLRVAESLSISPPLPPNSGAGITFAAYLPAGSWDVGFDGPIRSWHLGSDASRATPGHLTVRSSSWRRLMLTVSPLFSRPVHLIFRKRS